MTTPASPSFRIIGGDGHEYGPVDLATLQEWAQQHRVAGSTKVWDSRTGNWLPAEQIAELAPLLNAAPAAAPPPVAPPPLPVAPRTNALAVWSFSLAMTSLFCSCCGCFAIPAIVLGAVSLSQINARREGGHGLAIAGIVIGIAVIVLSFLCALLWCLYSGHCASGRCTIHFV